MASIELIGQAARAEGADKPKALHPCLYLVIGFIGLVAAALLLDALAGLIA